MSSDNEFCDRLSRRTLLQAGLAGTIGLSVPEILRLQAANSRKAGTAVPDTAVIYVEMAGGPTQHETYDPKPDAATE